MKRIYNPYIASTKSDLLHMLAARGDESARRLCHAIRQRRGRITYQAVFKALQELVRDEQVIKVTHGIYTLNPLYLQDVAEWCRDALVRCPLNIREAGFYV